MKNNKLKIILYFYIAITFLGPEYVGAQSINTTIHSAWDDYLYFLSLRGDIPRPYLTIRQLARNSWDSPGTRQSHPWAGLESPGGSTRGVPAGSILVLPVENFSSYNSRYALGGNDGNMWQGRGFNTRSRLGTQGIWQFGDHRIGITAYPEFWAAENRDFELVDPDDLLSVTGFFGDPDFGYITRHMDLPQRMGDRPLSEIGFGESEVRYDYRALTIGYGTQSVWLGPGRENALVLSTNAGGFPKLDLGLRKTETRIGAMEAIAFWGQLTPSDFFDTTNYDNHNFYSGMAVAYSPVFWQQFTVGFNKVAIVQWQDVSFANVLQPFNLELTQHPGEGGQMASLTGEYFSPETGTAIYLEWARYDSSSSRNPVNVPGWTVTWTLGGRQVFSLGNHRLIVLSVEHTDLARSREQMLGPRNRWDTAGFYRQGNVGTGFTHRGQVLGGWIGPGGDSQHVSIRYYDRFGYLDLFVRRFARNKDVLYFQGRSTTIDGVDYMVGPASDSRQAMNAEMQYGIGGYTQIGSFALGLQVSLHDARNWNYRPFEDVLNARVEFGVTWNP